MAGLKDNILRIVLVGKTGSGKSATGNSILGRKAFESKISAEAVTKKCHRVMRHWKGRELLVVDTPGLFDTEETLKTTCEHISECVLYSYPGPHAIILVLRLDRYTEEEQKTVALIKNLFGEKAMKHMIVLFTRKDELGDLTLHEFIEESEVNLQSIIKECGNRCCAFYNRSTDEAEKEAQLQELVKLIEEVVQENGGAHFSDAIYKNIGEKLQRQEEALKKIYADQLQKENKLIEEKYAKEKISEQDMKEMKKKRLEDYNEKIKKIREEAGRFVGLALGNHVVRKPQLPIERPCDEDLKSLAHTPGWSFICQQNQLDNQASEATWKQIIQLPTEPPQTKQQREM